MTISVQLNRWGSRIRVSVCQISTLQAPPPLRTSPLQHPCTHATCRYHQSPATATTAPAVRWGGGNAHTHTHIRTRSHRHTHVPFMWLAKVGGPEKMEVVTASQVSSRGNRKQCLQNKLSPTLALPSSPKEMANETWLCFPLVSPAVVASPQSPPPCKTTYGVMDVLITEPWRKTALWLCVSEFELINPRRHFNTPSQ